MKKTIYFTGTNHQIGQLDVAIKTATDKRDTWLMANESKIGKIDNEDIKIIPWNGNNGYVMITILLTYYPK
ncbi:hypothetical protein GWK08_16835 [Leptobacterium flavescens]|uniref:Uncharacterized protein n=1 Tax=Leptobacterium flavescens TaxID=472055 RepID=A0A6P0UWI7_9FLAO|nr:hypothetical protein [Leptobacterium flavescens]NER15123.1 hypothetical protein [Leptobacterium flavescens]